MFSSGEVRPNLAIARTLCVLIAYALAPEAWRFALFEVKRCERESKCAERIMTIDIKRYIAEVSDFPKPGILFRDISPLLQNPEAFKYVISLMVEEVAKSSATALVAIESRGFLFAAPVAHHMGIPLVLVRKAGKLPGDLVSVSYGLEYGADTLEMKSGILASGDRVMVIDDVLATGGTAAAAGELVDKVGGQVVSYLFLAELSALEGRSKLGSVAVRSLVAY